MGRHRGRKNRSHKQCNACFNTHSSHTVIPNHFARFNATDLWITDKSMCEWIGTSEEWIEKNTAKCPNCYVPIEKVGGCNNVRCTICDHTFNWVNAKNGRRWKPITFIKIFFYLISFGIFFYISLKMYGSRYLNKYN